MPETMNKAKVPMNAQPGWLVACCCAAWCRTCDDYRQTFDAATREFAGWRFVWIDIEDQSELMDDFDVETFPTLLVGQGPTLHFAGPLTPQPETLSRLLDALRARGEAGASAQDAAALALWQRLRRIY